MSSSTSTSSSSSRNRQSSQARVLAETTLDAELNDEYEESGDSFDYSKLVEAQRTAPPLQQGRSEKVIAYLQHIQTGKIIQPFGCLLALDEKSFNVIAFSENAPEMLTTVSHEVTSVDNPPRLGIGTNVQSLFTDQGATALHKALRFADVSLLNPILVQCKTSDKPFYAIVHRSTGCLVVDFEPVEPTEFPATAAGALHSYKLAAKAISKIQSARVMAYKFHEDDHGEVFAEITKPGLEPYLGLHYPATDIPQASRFLFMKNKVRMICDCRARSIKVIEDEAHPFDISLCGSALRAPHGCHLQYMENMNTIASLVMAVVVNDNEEEDEVESEQPAQHQQKKKLWGLLVCHHESPRYVPFPLRYACEFLAQVFAVHRSLSPDYCIRETGTPNVMDLVKCDGAALLNGGKVWRMCNAPTESQIHDIALWLSEVHRDSTGLSTDSLHDAGYPGASALGDMICGMAVAKINSKDVLFWFRSHTAAEIRWAGAKNDSSDMDDSRKMNPRLSFKAFLEVVKMKSLSWTDYEIDAIHSLQLILRDTLNDAIKPTCEATLDKQIGDLKLDGLAELQAVTSEMIRLMETATVPILAVDVNGLVNGWNQKAAELTGLRIDDAIGRDILSLVEKSSEPVVQRMLYLALQGKEEKEVQFEVKTHGPKVDDVPVILIVNACATRDLHGDVVGVCFVAQDMTVHKLAMDKFTRVEGDYMAIIHNPNPLIPPIFGADEFGWCSEWNAAMTKLTGCSCLDLEMAEFVLQDVVMAAVSQVLLACQGKGIRVSCDMPEILMKQLVYGDGVRLQQILSDVLFVSVKFSPVGGSVGISSKLTKKSIRGNLHLIDLEIRIKHQGLGVPAELMSQMFEEDSQEKSEEGLSLLVSRNLLSLMKEAAGRGPFAPASDCSFRGGVCERVGQKEAAGRGGGR
ncbi:hypothetical protein ACQ4PT_006374 [Festuca glaucescens]